MPYCSGTRNPQRRFRGTIYLALQSTRDQRDHFTKITVCVDYARACAALAHWPTGSIWRVPPPDGAPLRSFLAGGSAPYAIAMAAFPVGLVKEIADAAAVTERTARRAIADTLAKAPGAGGELWRGRSTLVWVSIHDG